MHFSLSVFASALVGITAVLATPVPMGFTGCDISNVKFDSALLLDPKNATNLLVGPASNEKLSRIVLGYGSQNYSCIAGVPTANGAVATLYDISCPVIDNVDFANLLTALFVQMNPNAQSNAIKMAANVFNTQFTVGFHYFKGDFATPAFEFSDQKKFFGAVAGKVSPIVGSDMGKKPDAYGAVPSLRLSARPGMGSSYSTIYRLHTAGGAAPTTCNWSGQKQIPYAAQYWVYRT
ncbi:hypothetical protein ABW20_dc0104648 [Dactylellina cionopaga]|nr:hypothetical protein ABW20_dc0104648 [Dactylellina cionopaga]